MEEGSYGRVEPGVPAGSCSAVAPMAAMVVDGGAAMLESSGSPLITT